MSRDWDCGLQLLRQAHEIYDKDPLLNINLAFSLRRSGDCIRAAGLLIGAMRIFKPTWGPFCIANAAFCLIQAGRVNKALNLLEILSSSLSVRNDGRIPIDAANLPGVAVWADEDSFLEEQLGSALALMRKAIGDLPPGTEIPSSVVKVVEAYRMASGAG
jgi:hypothetical protein